MNIRVRKSPGEYATIHKAASLDHRLSYKALGLHTHLMCQADNWEANETDLIQRHSDGRAAVRSGIDELIKYGYMVRVQERENGKIIRWRLDCYEVPQEPESENRILENELESDFQLVENQLVENRTHNNNNTNNNNNNNICTTDVVHAASSAASSQSSPSQSKSKKKPKRKTAYVNPDTGYGTKDIMAAYVDCVKENEPGAVLAFGKEGAAAKSIAAAGTSPDEVTRTYLHMHGQQFWKDKHIPLATVGQNIGAVVNGNGNGNRQRQGANADAVDSFFERMGAA